MKVHIIHAKNFWFKSNKPATKIREEPKSLEETIDNTLVIFTTVEQGDDEAFDRILPSLVKDVKNLATSLKPSSIVLYPYAHLSENLAPPSKAIEILNKVYNKLKESLPDMRIEKAPFGWYKEFSLHCYGHPMSELSRRYNSRTIEEKKQCFDLSETVKKIKIKPAYKDVFKRWGYPNIKGISFVQLNSFIAMIHSILGDSLARYTISSCNTSELLYNQEPSPALILDANGYHYIVAEKELLIDTLNRLFNENISAVNGRIEMEGMEIGKCVEERCITTPLEEILVLRIYLSLRRAENGETPTLECWLTPCNFYIATATGEKEEAYLAEKIAETLEKHGNSRVCLDKRQVRLGRKLRDAGRYWSSYTIIIGKNDLSKGIINIRDRKTGVQFTITVNKMEEELQEILAKCKAPIGYTKVFEN